MADGVSESPQMPVRAGEAHESHESHEDDTRERIHRHSRKFQAVTAMLIGFAIGAVAVAVAIALSSHPGTSGERWSTWSPPDGGVAGERDIANEVSPLYRADPADQLAVVTVQNINDASAASATSGSTSGASTQIAIRDSNSGGLSALSGSTAVYNLCGLGPNCSIAVGTPSQARLLLLRREALELALYTFKYIGGVDNVVALLPPGHTTQACTGICPKPPTKSSATTSPLSVAVAFQRQSLRRFLQQPLRQTLPEDVPPLPAAMAAAPDAELISVITSQALFRQQLIQAQDGSNVIVLDPLPAQ